jgi:glycosyltransferase involved in cell wall biosynthesis
MEKKKPIYKIAYVIDDLGYGGAQTLLVNLVSSLPEEFTPQVYCLSEITSPHADTMRRCGTSVFAFKRRSHVDAGRLIALARTMRREHIDLIHSFLDSSNAYGYIAGRLLKIPTVLSLQSNQLMFGQTKKQLLRFMLRHADKVTVNSKAGEAFLLNSVAVPRQKVLRIRNWIHTIAIPPSNPDAVPDPPSAAGTTGASFGSVSPGEHGKIIGYVGRLAKEKRIDVLIEAFAHLANTHLTVRLHIVGDGPERPGLENRVRQLNLGDRIEFLGHVGELEPVMNHFSCLVLPSAFEGLPNVILEALAMGLPVVASPVGDIADIIQDGHTGRIVNGDSPEALSSALEDTIEDEDLFRRTRIEGPRMIASNFSISAALDVLLPTYRELIHREK